jgi:peptidylprolyl isomerase
VEHHQYIPMSIIQGHRIPKTGLALLFVSALLLAACLLSAGCTSSPGGAQLNDTVRVHYNVSVQGGQVFESSLNGTPIEFTIGSGKMIPGFEQGVIGMKPGETKRVTITPENAYGPVNASLIQTIPRTGQLATMDLKPGYIQYTTQDGRTGRVLITNVTSTTITVDENHPLAGKTLVFDITLVEIVKKPS